MAYKNKIDYQIDVDQYYKFNTANVVLKGTSENGTEEYTFTQNLVAKDVNSNGTYLGSFELEKDKGLAYENTISLTNMLFCTLSPEGVETTGGDCGANDLNLNFSYKFYDE